MPYAALAGALSVGLSPVLYEWAVHLSAEPATRYALIFPVLLVLASRRSPREEPSLRRGAPWLVTAAAVEAVAFVGGVPRFARIAFPLGVIGWLRASGLAPLSTALLALWLVPAPRSLEQLGFEVFGGAWSAWADACLPGTRNALTLDAWDSGVRLVVLLAGIGWYAAVRQGTELSRALRRAALYGLAGPPVQALGILATAGLLAVNAPDAAQAWRVHGLWIATAGVALGASFVAARRREARGV